MSLTAISSSRAFHGSYFNMAYRGQVLAVALLLLSYSNVVNAGFTQAGFRSCGQVFYKSCVLACTAANAVSQFVNHNFRIARNNMRGNLDHCSRQCKRLLPS